MDWESSIEAVATPATNRVHLQSLKALLAKTTEADEILPKNLKLIALNLVDASKVPDKNFRRVIHDLVSSLAGQRDGKFLEFAATAIAEKGKTLGSDGQGATNLFRMACVVIRATQDVPEWFSKFAPDLCDIMEIATKSHQSAANQQELRKLLRAKPMLLRPLIDLVTSQPPKGSQPRFEPVFTLCKEARSLDSYDTEVKALFMNMFMRDVLTSREQRPDKSLQRFVPFLESLTHEDMKESLQENLIRQAKKSGDATIQIASLLTKFVKLDLSRYGDVLFPIALGQLKSSKEAVRMDAVSLILNVVVATSDIEVVLSVMQQISKILGGVVSQAHHKLAIIAAIEAVREGITSKSRSAIKPVVEIAVEILEKFAKKEKLEDAQNVAVSSLSKWLCLHEDPPKSVFAFFLKGLKSKVKEERARSAFGLAVASVNSATHQHCMEFVDVLEAMVMEAQKKPKILHIDAVAALVSLLRLQSMQMEIASQLKSSKIWKLFIQDDAFFFSRTFLQSSTSREANSSPSGVETALVLLAEGIGLAVQHHEVKSKLLEEMSRVNEGDNQDNGPAEPQFPPKFCLSTALLLLLTHPSLLVRNSAVQTAKIVQISLVELIYPTMLAFRHRLGQLSDRMNSSIFAKEEDSTDRSVHRSTLVTALLSLIPDHPHKSLLPLSLFLSNHPLLNPRTKRTWYSCTEKNRVWTTLCCRFGGLVQVSESLVEQSTFEAITSMLLHQQGFYSEQEQDRIAAYCVVASLLEMPGAGGHAVVVEGTFTSLLSDLSSQNLTGMTAKEVGIWKTPEGELYVEDSFRNGYIPQGAGSRKMRSSTRLYDNEDEELEAQVRSELENKKSKGKKPTSSGAKKSTVASGSKNAKKPGGKGKSAAKQESREDREKRERLEEEALVRRRIDETVSRAEYALQALAAAAQAVPLALHSELPSITPVVLSLLSSQSIEIAGKAFHTLKCVAGAVDPCVEDVATDIATALRIAVLHPDKLVQNEVLLETLLEDLVPICSLTEEQFGALPLPAATFAVLFPICKAVCKAENMNNEVYEGAFGILAMHGQMDKLEASEIEVIKPLRRGMVEVTLHMIASAPQLNPSPDQILKMLVSGPALSVAEWNPLLNDLGLLHTNEHVRCAVLNALMNIVESSNGRLPVKTNPLLTSRMWLAQYDEADKNRILAETLWDASESELKPLYAPPLLALLSHKEELVRNAAASSISAALVEHPDSSKGTLKRLFQVGALADAKSLAVPEIGPDGFPLSPGEIERLMKQMKEENETKATIPRLGVAATLLAIGEEDSLVENPEQDLNMIFPFLVEHGLVAPSSDVRAKMLKAGMALVDTYGADHMDTLLPLFEKYMAAAEPADASADDLNAGDYQREGLVVFLGTMAKHLDKNDPRVQSAIKTLIAALSTPSEAVQQAVAQCLSPLVPAVKDHAPEKIISQLMTQTLKGESYGDRRGGAYGISAMVKGLGITALKQNDIIPQLEKACKGKSGNPRQGALFAFECLCSRLGLLFEPYIIPILPVLLECFSDKSATVREAANGTARAIMNNLTAHGVKLVLPALLKSLNDPQWRSKKAAIELLGAMAYCAPRQLSTALPRIVPKITDAFTDTKKEIREAGKHALADIASVVRNPEISQLCPKLLDALSDPTEKTQAALQALQDTAFVHSIDAPSLALIVPILSRGLKERNSQVKKKAALIVGNICSMISDAKDLLPYIDLLMPHVKNTITDPIPDVRTIASKAMGRLAAGMGEEHFPTLVEELLSDLRADTSSVERSGAGQAVSEVLVSLGRPRLQEILDLLLPQHEHEKFFVREGVLWMLAFLPAAMGVEFSEIIGVALPIIIAGLADEAEPVRDVAMRAGQVLVSAHALSHTKMLLPALEAGVFNDNWRIRQSSVLLLGDLLYRVGGTKALAGVDAEDDDSGAGSAQVTAAIMKALGTEARNSVFAALYIVRSDSSAVVRQSALQVWKSVVSNTPRTLRQILSALMTKIIEGLSSRLEDARAVAGKALGDIVRKLGERVMPEIVPILQAGLKFEGEGEGNWETRQGVCLGLSEVISCATNQQLEAFKESLLMCVQEALSDAHPSVREAAAHTFQMLTRKLGDVASNEILPTLLQDLDKGDESFDRALHGLKEILSVRSGEVLPVVIPKLLSTPITVQHAKALGAVAQVTSATIHHYFKKILPALTKALIAAETEEDSDSSDVKAAIEEAFCGVLKSFEDGALHWGLVEILEQVQSHEDPEWRRVGAWLLGAFVESTEQEYHDEISMILRELLVCFNDADARVQQVANDALKKLSKAVKPEELVKELDFTRNTIAGIVSDAKYRRGAGADFVMPGFCLKKGLEPLLPMYQHGLMYGAPDVRESAAAGLGELITLTTPAALKPFLIKITGPLIRLVGDKFPWQVKAAILGTLSLLLEKGGIMLKPFLPQLQTSFIKALKDPSDLVRKRGGQALTQLTSLNPRVDLLCNELLTGSTTEQEMDGVQASMLVALDSVVLRVGKKMTPGLAEKMLASLVGGLDHPIDEIRAGIARALGAVITVAPDELVMPILKDSLLHADKGMEWQVRHGRMMAIAALLRTQSEVVDQSKDGIQEHLLKHVDDDNGSVLESCAIAIGRLIPLVDPSETAPLLRSLATIVSTPSSEVRKTASRAVKQAAKSAPEAFSLHFADIVPALMALRESTVKNIPVRLSAERALFYILKPDTDPDRVQLCAKSVPSMSGEITTYARRVLSKLKPDSGDEDED